MDNGNIKISIIIPVYNSERFLNECLESVINQSYRNIEVLCVNDGSTDHSLEILNEYSRKDARIRVFTKKNEGKGAASARNMGLENATGDYILFLDSDDFYADGAIEKLVLKVNKTDDDLVVFSVDTFNQQLKKFEGAPRTINLQYAPAGKEVFSYKDCPDKIYQIGDFITWNKMYKRDLIFDNGLRFEAIPISDDQYVPNLSMVLAERITCVTDKLLVYRTHIGTSQVDSYTRHPTSSYLATYSVVDKLREYGVYQDVKRSYLNCAVRLMREYFDKMDKLENLKFLYEKFIGEVFPRLEVVNLEDGFFYDERIMDWYRLITTNSVEEILFKAARGYGNQMTSAILRFQVPYERITKGSRIVLVGKGLTAHYWYAQLLISDYAEVVAWVDHKEDVSKGTVYDDILIVG